MNNGYSRSEQRRAAARKYAVQCMNARGEVECSECNAGVDEARGNRNAQELDREKIRKSSKGPICNACQASWRYSHHQEPEMANESVSKDQKEVEEAASWIRARKWGSEDDAIQAAIDEANFSSQAAMKAAGLVARSNPKAFENAKKCEECDATPAKQYSMEGNLAQTLCKVCATRKGYVAENADNTIKCPHCGDNLEFDPGRAKQRVSGHLFTTHQRRADDAETEAAEIVSKERKNASGCGICGEKGHVYDVDGDKKILCEKHAKESGGVLLSNADSEKCSRCGTKVGAMGVDHGNDVYCVDCAVEKGYIDKKDVA